MLKYLINLQMFAGDDDDSDAGKDAGKDANGKDDDSGSDAGKDTKTFTQKDMDAAIDKGYAKGAKKSQKDYQNTEDYKSFKSWESTNKTEMQRLQDKADKADTLAKENAQKQSEIDGYKNKSLLIKEGVSQKHGDFVLFEVTKLVSDDKDFGEAMEEYKKAEPGYFGEDEDEEAGGKDKNFRTSAKKKKGTGGTSNADAFLNRKYKNSRYRKD